MILSIFKKLKTQIMLKGFFWFIFANILSRILTIVWDLKISSILTIKNVFCNTIDFKNADDGTHTIFLIFFNKKIINCYLLIL